MAYDTLYALRSMLELITELLYDVRDDYPAAEKLATEIWAVLADLPEEGTPDDG